MKGYELEINSVIKVKTRLPASRSSSVGPEGRFSFFHPKVKVKKTISLTSFVFWGLVGLKELINFTSFQGFLTNVVFHPHPFPTPHSSFLQFATFMLFSLFDLNLRVEKRKTTL